MKTNNPVHEMLMPVTTIQQSTFDMRDEPEQEIDLKVYWPILKPHLWSILGVATMVALLATFIVFIVSPVYRSTASLIIDQQQSKVLMMGDAYDIQSANEEYFDTQVEIIQSRDLAQKVIDKLNLAENKVITDDLWGDKTEKWETWEKMKAWLKAFFDQFHEQGIDTGSIVDYKPQEELIDYFLKKLSVESRKLT